MGDSFVRLIPFKDHINIEAEAINQHREELSGYKITPKGMLQIYVKQELPYETFVDIVWAHEPIGSGELVKLCEKKLNWKKLQHILFSVNYVRRVCLKMRIGL